MIKRNIPNIVTLLNMGCGCVATIYAVQANLVYAAAFVILGIFFDFFDGLLARKLNVQSALGLQLDSLADMITSGLVPGIVMVQLMIASVNFSGGNNPFPTGSVGFLSTTQVPIWVFLGLLITLASGYRLAKFNIDERQTSSFIGLPTPANALLILSLALIVDFQSSELLYAVILNPLSLLVLTGLSCLLLNAELPLFALKFKTWNFRDNWYRYLFLGASLLLLILLKFIAIPIIIFLYILSSIFVKKMLTK